MRPHGCRPQRHHCPPVRLAQRRAQPLVRRGAGPVAVALVQTRGTRPRLGGNIRRAVACHSRVVIEPCPRCERLAALEVPQDALEQGAEGRGRPRSAYRPPPRIARDPCDAVDGLHMALSALCIQGEPARRGEGNHGARCPQRSGARTLRLARAGIWQAGKAAWHQAPEHSGSKRCALFGSNAHPEKPQHQNVRRFLRGASGRIDVYEKPIGTSRWLLGSPTFRELLTMKL